MSPISGLLLLVSFLISSARSASVGRVDICGITTDGTTLDATMPSSLITLNNTVVNFDGPTMTLALTMSGLLASPIGTACVGQGCGANPQMLINIKTFGMVLITATAPLCALVSCPMQAGDFNFTYSLTLPVTGLPPSLFSSGGPPILEFDINTLWYSDPAVSPTFKTDFLVSGATANNFISCNTIRFEMRNTAYNLGLSLGTAGVAIISGIATILASASNIAFNTLVSRDVTYNPDPVTIIMFVQFASRLGQLSIDYPPTYQGFTGKLGWASLSFPWTTLPAYLQPASQMVTVVSGAANEASFPILKKRGADYSSSGLGVVTGLDLWALIVGVAPGSLLFGVLSVLAIAIGAVVIGLPVFTLLLSRSMIKTDSVESFFGAFKKLAFYFCGILTRVFIVAMIPVLTVSFRTFQTQATSLNFIIAIIAVALYAILLIGAAAAIVHTKRKDLDSSDSKVNIILGPLFAVYHPMDWTMFFVDYVYGIGQAVAVGLIGSNGLAQCIILGSTEVIMLFFYVILRPRKGVFANIVLILTSIIRCACVGIAWTFLPRFNFTNDMKAMLGYAEIALFLVLMIVFLIISLINLIRGIVFAIKSCHRSRKTHRVSPIVYTNQNKRPPYWRSKVHPSSESEEGGTRLLAKNRKAKKSAAMSPA
ncbi:hypothetical protein SmJEL517_g04601 [Synchytrium microbalum]|uniref:TRP C-terminal domain-containing protein n=1 Tax=Synchytrium microbalum TaxID=1806994 RepID=A0A507C2F6_9FUNG|nr:uncharacterized protein SmJEL517_g04601 [Synchytrium microbalum]TPX32264.1 hypothetical protein SmJEL517_g04601 [Synchytrium microbalum]